MKTRTLRKLSTREVRMCAGAPRRRRIDLWDPDARKEAAESLKLKAKVLAAMDDDEEAWTLLMGAKAIEEWTGEKGA